MLNRPCYQRKHLVLQEGRHLRIILQQRRQENGIFLIGIWLADNSILSHERTQV